MGLIITNKTLWPGDTMPIPCSTLDTNGFKGAICGMDLWGYNYQPLTSLAWRKAGVNCTEPAQQSILSPTGGKGLLLHAWKNRQYTTSCGWKAVTSVSVDLYNASAAPAHTLTVEWYGNAASSQTKPIAASATGTIATVTIYDDGTFTLS